MDTDVKSYTEKQLEDKSSKNIVEELSTDPEKGLTELEAKKRVEKYGLNTIQEKKSNPLKKFFLHFWGPIPGMLEIACILAAVGRRWEDFSVIFLMLLINGGVSYWHENKAENAIEALKEKLSPTARVLRDGKKNKIKAENLVPGDIVILKMGDVVPADTMLLSDQNLNIDESTLTGESVPVDKQENDLCFSGTSVKRGEAKGVVVTTGEHTKFAKTVKLVEEADVKSHFQKAVIRIGKFLIGVTFGLVGIIVVVGIIRSDPLFQVLMFALVVIIAGIPSALPAVLSVTMTIGASRLAKYKAIVSKLSAMEEMAGLEVLCADKTGTLTMNKLEMQEPVILNAKDKHDLLIAAALTCKRDETEDPIDVAVLKAVEDKSELDDYTVNEFRPFDPTGKRAEADVEKDGNSFTVAKGAPQIILDLVGAKDKARDDIARKVDELGDQGYRALGVARKQKGQWQYLGILPLLDPPREGTKDVIESAKDHGIDIRMVTGDHAAIAKQVAGQVGLGDKVVKAVELFEGEDGEAEDSISEEVIKADAFAQVTPEHKFNIIKHFQKEGRIVGMTGDGINDAPALKQADVGIAVAGAADAARSAANLVLTEPGLGVITRAVEESRRIFERMTGYSIFRITESMRVLLFMTLSILFFNFYPVTAIMVVLLAILNDIPIMMIAYDNVETAKAPVRWNMPRVLTTASILSVSGVISSFLFFWFIKTHLGFQQDTVRTMIFLKLLVAGHMTIFITRTSGWIWQKPYPNLKFFAALEATQVLGTLFAVYGIIIPPVGWGKALAVWGYALVWLLVLNAVIVIGYRYMDKKKLGKRRAKDELARESRRAIEAG